MRIAIYITFLAVPDVGLFFSLNGIVYPPGVKLLITDVGESAIEGAGSSLVCITSNINTQNCRGSDGGIVGEWFFPDGTMVPRNSSSANANFTRGDFTEQIRLNRRNNALMPTGIFSCRVTGIFSCRVPDYLNRIIHEAIVTLVGKQWYCSVGKLW